jgi:hypothetical protein
MSWLIHVIGSLFLRMPAAHIKPFANLLQELNSLEILLTKEMKTQMCVGDGEIGIEMIFEWT